MLTRTRREVNGVVWTVKDHKGCLCEKLCTADIEVNSSDGRKAHLERLVKDDGNIAWKVTSSGLWHSEQELQALMDLLEEDIRDTKEQCKRAYKVVEELTGIAVSHQRRTSYCRRSS